MQRRVSLAEGVYFQLASFYPCAASFRNVFSLAQAVCRKLVCRSGAVWRREDKRTSLA